MSDLDDTQNSISQVGSNENEKKSLPTPVVVLIAFSLVIVSIFVILSGDEEEEDITFTDEEYKVKTTKIPQAPTPKPVFKQQFETEIPAEENNDLFFPEEKPKLSQDEMERLKQAEKLRLRRLHSPVLKINKKKKKRLGNNNDDSFQNHPVSSKNYLSSLKTNATRNANLKIDKILNGATNQNQNNESNAVFDSPSLNSLQTSPVVSVTAGYMENMSFKIAQGKIIPAILETAIQSNLIGMLRAIVSEAVYSEDGNTLLIPKGSRLVGEYQSGLKKGQGRIFVIWSRLIRPDGIDMKIDSPNTDSIGLSGMGGFVDYHFLERFGASVMMSLISAFAQSESDKGNSREALSDSFAKSTEIILEDSIKIAPTLHLNQGEKINVFIAKDLDFTQAILLKHKLEKAGRLR